ncbi:MAG TPA: cyclophane-forming radical SAM/SPASM peptide maturase GrrM/OscB [Ktedonobacteraceae bacterium]
MVATQLVIIQPTSQCNINCSYCYLPERTLKKRINMRTVARIGEALFASPFVGESISIVWHAGEPLILPVRFYEQALHCLQEQNTRGVRIEHHIQTNATLITQEWCDFFQRQHIQIGVSLDGPQFVHNASRVDRGGAGTFEHTMRGVRLLQQNAIPFAVIAVVTQHSLPFAQEIWRFFSDLRPRRLCFNAEEQEGIHLTSSLYSAENVARYQLFLREIFACNTQAGEPLKIREFETIRERIQFGKLWARSQTNIPGAIFSFDCDGNVSTFSPEMLTMAFPEQGAFQFGNVFTHTLEQVLASQKCLQVQAAIQRGVSRCLQTCEYFVFCGGGYPSNKLSEHQTFDASETHACRLRVKATADVVLEHLESKAL